MGGVSFWKWGGSHFGGVSIWMGGLILDGGGVLDESPQLGGGGLHLVGGGPILGKVSSLGWGLPLG